MIHIKDHKTLYLFDLFEFLGPKRRKMLNDSWAGIFRDHVRHVLPVELLAKQYCSDNGRPTMVLFIQRIACSYTFVCLYQATFDLTLASPKLSPFAIAT